MIHHSIDSARLLIVSGNSELICLLRSIGNMNGWQLEIAANAWDAIDRVQAGLTLDLLLLDLQMEDRGGLHILRWLRRFCPTLPMILIDHGYDANEKHEFIRMGVGALLNWPVEQCQLEDVIQSNLAMAHEANVAIDEVEPIGSGYYFVGASPIMRKLRAQAKLLAESDLPVLILGEDGSGKETVARLVHSLSVRSGMGFAKVNCAALPEELLERELFGEETRDATATARTRIGKLELCVKGTVLLEEIADAPPGIQEKLLQVLRCKQFIRSGTSDRVVADVRIIAACFTDVERAMSENGLREDLYHYLNAYTIHVPPLRERKSEIPILSRHFMHRIATHYGLSPREFSPAIAEAWQAYSWPGNLRELEECVKRYLMVGDEELAHVHSQRTLKSGNRRNAFARASSDGHSFQSQYSFNAETARLRISRSLLHSVKSKAERRAIAAALEDTGWNRKAAARLLNISYRNVLYKIEEYHIAPSISMRQSSQKGSE